MTLQPKNADGTAASAGFVHNRQARRAMLVEFPARFTNPLICATAGRRGPHDLFDAHLRSAPVISGHAATHVALGDHAYQREGCGILHYRRAATS